MKNIIDKSIFLLVLSALFIVTASCTKGFLEKKSSSNIVVPTRLEELQGLLDNEEIVFETPLLGTQSADEYYFTYEDWQAMNPKERNAYIWAKDVYEGHNFVIKDWNVPYQQIFYANIVLKTLSTDIYDMSSAAVRSIKGSAYFLRARAYFNLAEHFAMPYDRGNAGHLMGVPIRLTADVNHRGKRSTLEETYNQILNDLQQAISLLEDISFPMNKLRPNKLTAWGYLSRIYLSMREYEKAGRYADSVLRHYDKLIDYNSVSSATISTASANQETFLQSRMVSGVTHFTTVSGTLHVDTNLYQLFGEYDLRRTLLYRKDGDRVRVRKAYTGLIQFFSGLTTAELYLIRAESNARAGNVNSALKDLNYVIKNRHDQVHFEPMNLSEPSDVLDCILLERRKELAFRGLRWSDIRRLNLEGRGITLRRKLRQEVVELLPNDPRYALPIPQSEIELSGIQQNGR